MLKDAFASNLSRLCQGERSIAAVCRATKINRQQFNRYLAAEMIPRHQNIEKICRHFDISESELFRESEAPASRSRNLDGESEAWAHEEVRAALKLLHSDTSVSLPPGIYFAHFTDPNDPSSIMRSTVVVKRDGNRASFRRLTCMWEANGTWWANFSSDHKGIILERRHSIYFLGLNQLADREPTLLVMKYMPNINTLLGGHAAIVTPIGPTMTAVVMSRCERGMTLRKALRASHAYSAEDAALDPIILEALDHQCRVLLNTVGRLNPGMDRPGMDRGEQTPSPNAGGIGLRSSRLSGPLPHDAGTGRRHS